MTHIKKHFDSFPDIVDMRNANVRLRLLKKVWEEYIAVQDQLEYNDDDETRHRDLDREAVTETYCELKARIDGFQKTEEQETLVKQNHRSVEQNMTMAIV